MDLLDLCLFSSLSVLLTELSPRSLNIFICVVFEESLFFYTNLLQLKSAEFNQWNIGACDFRCIIQNNEIPVVSYDKLQQEEPN